MIVRIALTGEPVRMPQTPLLCRCALQLQEYFAGERRVFDVPVSPRGTSFQRAVWAALADIPYGETRTYAQIACAVGNPGAVRAVGQANHANPLLVAVPCHRVVRADGTTGGYSGGENVKRQLLALEGNPDNLSRMGNE